MRKVITGVALFCALALLSTPADAKRKHHSHKASGVKGVVLDSTCPGACADPPPPEPVYSGPVTITVARASDGVIVASRAVDDGHFRIRVKAGAYDVSSVPPSPSPQPCPPGQACPLDQTQAQRPAVISSCMQGETKPAQVRRHRFTHVELHVSNTCIV